MSELTNTSANSWLSEINWPESGLIPAVAQDYMSGKVLMLAWMNREALQATAREQRAVYWSRSRQQLWRKGEQSGHVQKLHDMRLDCDQDAILLRVEQIGGIACHTGRESCFYLRFDEQQWLSADPVIKDPSDIY